MRRPRLTYRERYLLIKWVDENGIAGTRSETAKKATESLNFNVTADDISVVADALGIPLRSGKKPAEIIAQDLILLRRELGLNVSEELKRIAHKQAP